MTFLMVGVVLGGRLGHVILYARDQFLADPSMILRVWEGGMAFHGGVLGALLGLAWFAQQRGLSVLSDGDLVCVFNDRGSVVVPARTGPDVRTRDGMVIVPFGWSWPNGPTVNVLTSSTPTDWGGGVAFYDTLVEVTRSESGAGTPRN
jgi:hypothetical protein